MTDTPQTQSVLAAFERDAAASAVLGTAERFAEIANATVEGVHAGTSLPGTLATLTRRAGVTLRLVPGPPDRGLLAELERPGVRAIVMGAGHEHRGHHPAGPTTRYVAERSTKPVVVVPIDGEGVHGELRRLLVPLEGTESSSRPILEALLPLLVEGVEVEVLHVFTDETVPRMLDRPVRDTELLGREFLARHCPPAGRIVLHAGAVADRVQEVAEEHEAGMVVLSWSQDSSEGRARVVREVLATSQRPVLLLPVARDVGRMALPGPPVRVPL